MTSEVIDELETFCCGVLQLTAIHLFPSAPVAAVQLTLLCHRRLEKLIIASQRPTATTAAAVTSSAPAACVAFAVDAPEVSAAAQEPTGHGGVVLSVCRFELRFGWTCTFFFFLGLRLRLRFADATPAFGIVHVASEAEAGATPMRREPDNFSGDTQRGMLDLMKGGTTVTMQVATNHRYFKALA